MATGIFQKKEPTGVFWKDHSLSLVIAAILMVQSVFALWSGSYVFAREQPLGASTPIWSQGFWMW